MSVSPSVANWEGSRRKFSGICVTNMMYLKMLFCQFSVIEAVWGIFMNSCMWAAVHLDESVFWVDLEALQQSCRKRQCDTPSKVFDAWNLKMMFLHACVSCLLLLVVEVVQYARCFFTCVFFSCLSSFRFLFRHFLLLTSGTLSFRNLDSYTVSV